MSSRTSWCCLFFISLPIIIDARTIWDEITLEDYELRRVKVKPYSKNKPIPVECYQEIHRDGFDHIFKVRFANKDLNENDFRACLIALPTPVKIEYRQVNFHNNSTFTRILAGNNRSRPPLVSERITNKLDKPLDAVCAYAYLVVQNPSTSDTLTFKLSRFDEDYALYDVDYSPCDGGFIDF